MVVCPYSGCISLKPQLRSSPAPLSAHSLSFRRPPPPCISYAIPGPRGYQPTPVISRLRPSPQVPIDNLQHTNQHQTHPNKVPSLLVLTPKEHFLFPAGVSPLPVPSPHYIASGEDSCSCGFLRYSKQNTDSERLLENLHPSLKIKSYWKLWLTRQSSPWGWLEGSVLALLPDLLRLWWRGIPWALEVAEVKLGIRGRE